MKGVSDIDILFAQHLSYTAASPAVQTGRVDKRMALRRIYRISDAQNYMRISTAQINMRIKI